MGSESAAFLFSTPEMTVTFSLTRQLRAMMQFEWALTCALERQGIAEAGAGATLESLLDAEFVDIATLERDAHEVGNIVIFFIRQLTERVKGTSEPAARSIHFGATS